MAKAGSQSQDTRDGSGRATCDAPLALLANDLVRPLPGLGRRVWHCEFLDVCLWLARAALLLGRRRGLELCEVRVRLCLPCGRCVAVVVVLDCRARCGGGGARAPVRRHRGGSGGGVRVGASGGGGGGGARGLVQRDARRVGRRARAKRGHGAYDEAQQLGERGCRRLRADTTSPCSFTFSLRSSMSSSLDDGTSRCLWVAHDNAVRPLHPFSLPRPSPPAASNVQATPLLRHCLPSRLTAAAAAAEAAAQTAAAVGPSRLRVHSPRQHLLPAIKGQEREGRRQRTLHRRPRPPNSSPRCARPRNGHERRRPRHVTPAGPALPVGLLLLGW